MKNTACKIFLFTCLISVGQQSIAQTDSLQHFSFRGYLKNLQTWSWPGDPDLLSTDGQFHNRLIFKYNPDSAWTMDLELRNRFFYGESLKAAPDVFAENLEADPGLWDGSFVLLKNEAVVLHSKMDRLWVNYQHRSFEATLGRQRINWGIATTWNPNDLFNAWNFLDFDYEERPGVDALRLQQHFGGFSTLDFAVKPGKNEHDWIGALRYGANWKHYDFQWLAGRYHDQWTAGMGWAGALGQAGFKGELSVFKPQQRDSAATVSLTMQLDYLFSVGVYASAGFLYAGAAPGNGLNQSALQAENLAPDRLMPVRWSFLGVLSYPFTPLVNGSATVVYSPTDQLLILAPNAAYNISGSWDIDLTGQFFFGKLSGLKFADLYNAVFLRTKWSF